MNINIEINPNNAGEATMITIALQNLAKNINASNLMFLGEVSKKPDVNRKLEAKKGLIKTFL